MALIGGDEQVALRAIPGRVPHHLVKRVEERDGVQRHLDALRGGELRPHAAHALSGGAFTLVRFALENEYVAATGFGQMIRDAGPDNAAADDNDIGRLQENLLECSVKSLSRF